MLRFWKDKGTRTFLYCWAFQWHQGNDQGMEAIAFVVPREVSGLKRNCQLMWTDLIVAWVIIYGIDYG